jgi:hypothetical protein
MVPSRTNYTEVSIRAQWIYSQVLTFFTPAGMLNQQLPLVTTDPNKLEAQAKSILKPTAFNYVAGGAGERATMDANRLAFRQWKMVPRMLSESS